MKTSQLLARDLRKRIARNPLMRLPSVRELARKKRVSYPTMLGAVRLLVNEGILDCSQGRPPRIVNHTNIDGTPEPRRNAAAQALAARLLRRINGGTLHVGEEMPKFSFFVASERVSPSTITEAFLILQRGSAIHKRGRKWIVGPTPAAPAETAQGGLRRSGAPTVLFLTGSMWYWQEYFSAGHVVPFSAAFSSEALKNGLNLSLVTTDRTAGTSCLFPAGKDAIEECIASLGDRYRGTIVYHHPPFGEEMRDILSFLGTRRQPIVCLDSTDESPEFTRDLPGPKGSRFRVHLDEKSAVEQSIDLLCSLGHTRIGVAIKTDLPWLWARRRIEKILDCARSHPRAPQIITATLDETFWKFDDFFAIGASVHEAGTAVAAGASPVVHSATARSLIEATPSLVSLIDKGITALIALNDRMAWEFLVWFKAAGIRVPQRISVLSFDNMPQSVAFPISSLDFGLARLGYLAAHIFVGDLSIDADANGSIPGICQLVDRGSIARAPLALS